MDINYCSECDLKAAEISCNDCQELMCKLCDAAIHRKSKRKFHSRINLCKSCQRISDFYCRTCTISMCNQCSLTHSHDSLIPISKIFSTIIVWDCLSSALNSEKFKNIYEILSLEYKAIKKIKIYGQEKFFPNDLDEKIVEFWPIDSEDFIESMIIDISLIYNEYQNFLIVSQRLEIFKPYLNQIVESTNKNKFKFLNASEKSQKKSFEYHYIKIGKKSRVSQNSCENYEKIYIEELKRKAENGILIVNYSKFSENLSKKLQISDEFSNEILSTLWEKGIIEVIDRNFSLVIKTINLSVKEITPEVLNWVLQSLKKDEMLPSDKSIQARLKESFNFKLNSQDKQKILKFCKSPPQISLHDSNFSYFSLSLNSSPECQFELVNLKDSLQSTHSYLIYPIGEKWVAYDLYYKSGDFLKIKALQVWKSFNIFFTDYFSEENIETKGIVGGRYGCSQFLKHFANKELKKCSLGILSYMVQLAIDDDLLRYHKTTLVWAKYLKIKKVLSNDLPIMQKQIRQVLKEHRNGIPLAQLPKNLNLIMKGNIDIKAMGFNKLKDFISSIPNIKIMKKDRQDFVIFE